jgi:undecaprenyl-phosphate 4-deoxy-4-formamido-L-arabinose transferase
VDKIWFTRDLTLGISTVLGSIVFFSGIQLMILGLVGEYLGRLYLDQTGTPQSIVRYTIGANSTEPPLTSPSGGDDGER